MISGLSEMCKKHGFSRRGNAFFRVHGDGVLQVLKYSLRKRPFYEETIKVGLFSMYSELLPQWFTSSGCTPAYNAKYLELPNWSLETIQKLRRAAFENEPVYFNANDFENVTTFHVDLEGLERTLFPFLEEICTQDSMIRGLESLVQCNSPAPPSHENNGKRWTDMGKYAPYLATGEYENAAKIAQTLLNICMRNDDGTSARRTEDIQCFRGKIELALGGDAERISGYLRDNYARNCVLASFCMHSRPPKSRMSK